MNTGQDGTAPGRFDPVTGVRIWALDKVCMTGEVEESDDGSEDSVYRIDGYVTEAEYEASQRRIEAAQDCNCGLLTCESNLRDNEETLEAMKILDTMDSDDEAWMAEEFFRSWS